MHSYYVNLYSLNVSSVLVFPYFYKDSYLYFAPTAYMPFVLAIKA